MAWCVPRIGLLRVASVFLMLSSVSLLHVDASGMFMPVSCTIKYNKYDFLWFMWGYSVLNQDSPLYRRCRVYQALSVAEARL